MQDEKQIIDERWQRINRLETEAEKMFDRYNADPDRHEALILSLGALFYRKILISRGMA